MNDIRRPQRPPARPEPSEPKPVIAPGQARIEPPAPHLMLEDHIPLKASGKRKQRWARRVFIGLVGVILIGVVIAIIGFFWYQKSLAPVSVDANANRTQLTIEIGTTPSQIGQILFDKDLIRNKTAFDIYTRLSGTQNKLQAGSYRLSPAESTQEIVEHLVSGNIDEFSLTFYPGATLVDPRDIADSKKVDVTTVLKRAGYGEDEIKTALSKKYNHPLFEGKPASSDLEGYIYGETYSFSTAASVEDVLVRTFDEFYSKIREYDLIAGFKAKGMNLYQGITLASINQREVTAPSGDEPSSDQRQVAQVFYSRIDTAMMLGSDVTYQYVADKTGVPRDVNLDSPYNTRRYTGLPPGPISSPGVTALRATANPLPGEYLFFLSGDDDVTYFGKTVEEHEANIRNHCQEKCKIL